MIVAWLWAGRQSAVSHDSALVVHGIGEAMPAVIHVTAHPGFRGRRPGVVVHNAVLGSDEVMYRSGMVVTSVVRTLADVFGLDPTGAREAADDAIEQGLVRASSMRAAADRYPQARELFEVWLHD
jgi:predicted transcriptional regulator of viral defense system